MIGPKESFLSLVRLGSGHPAECSYDTVEWKAIKALADEQGLSGVLVDGIERLPSGQRPPKKELLRWIGQALKEESRYAVQQKSAREMAVLFHVNGIRTYVLKGDVVAECYPKPERRVSSDMDCFLLPEKGDFDAWKRGNDLVMSKGFATSVGFYKNSAFYLPGLTVENHRFLTPFRGNQSLKKLEALLQNLLRADKGEDRFEGSWLCRPPVMVSALFLIEHAYSHFLHEGLTWRMVLDWAMFSRKHKEEIDWNAIDSSIDEFGFRKFYDSYLRLGQYLIGDIPEDSLTQADKMMLADIWAPLDLRETLLGVKAKFELAGNYWRARWKYKYFTDVTWIRALLEWVFGAAFDRHPRL